MSALLIAQEAHTRPYVITIDGSAEAALKSVCTMEEERNVFNPMFLIDLDTGVVSRLVRDEEGGWKLNDTAFKQDIGILTPDEWFEEEEA